jgi:uncharacterized protein YkwD
VRRRRLPSTAVAAAAAVALSFAATATPAAADPGGGCSTADDPLTADEDPRSIQAPILCVLNAERAAAGLPLLSSRQTLVRAATNFAGAMVLRSFFAHRAPDGPDLARRLVTTGYLGRRAGDWVVGENLAWARGAAATPRAIVASWMASLAHRRNVLERRFRDVGIGAAAGTPGGPADGITVTADFGVRRIESRRRGRTRGAGPRRAVVAPAGRRGAA